MGSPDLQALPCWGKVRVEGTWGHMVASDLSDVVKFRDSSTGWESMGPRLWMPQWLKRDRVTGPTAAATQLPVAGGTTAVGRSTLCGLRPLLSPAFLGFWAQLMGLQALPPLFPWFHLLFVFQSTHL